MRALVTGASGFVGRHLITALRDAGDESFSPAFDVTDGAAIRDALDATRPTHVFHLAAQTFVPDSLASPEATYRTNVIGTARVAQAIREYAQTNGTMPRLIFTSSAEIYGPREAREFPLRESLDPRPANPYAASKAAAEALLLGEARSLKLDVVVARAFNHIGPGQSDRFVVPSFASQLARIARGAPPVLLVGNLEAARDFLDVRDVVRAYVSLARDGERSGIYNVCSGNAVTIRDVLRELVTIAHVPVEIREDPARMRPSDVPLLVGSAEKLRERTGWEPEIMLGRSLGDVYEAAYAVAS
ncbi:MAG TPA: GDP-mannose 4,6-dehydratase [Candidatus Baltobacteraceae bacterium]